MKYTNTQEGKEVLETVSNVISTYGMEVYKCWNCEELFAGQPELVEDEDEQPECGICTMQLRAERRDAFGLENAED